MGWSFENRKLDETPDDGLIRGHEWKIFPLLHRRHLFADVENFLLYDFYRTNGSVDENVFAYSNRHSDEIGLIIYHNRFADTRGWIKTSAAYLDKGSGDLRQKSLAEGLSLPFEGFVIFKDYVTHLEYIHSCAELWEKGLYVELNAYQCHAFMDFRFVESSEWEMVNSALNGAGVESMQAKWDEMFGKKEEVKSEKKEVEKIKKPRKKATAKKVVAEKKSIKRKVKSASKKLIEKKTVAAKSGAKKDKKPVSKKVTSTRPKNPKKIKKKASKKSEGR